jgi:polysaccharide biosynthesis protein PslG
VIRSDHLIRKWPPSSRISIKISRFCNDGAARSLRNIGRGLVRSVARRNGYLLLAFVIVYGHIATSSAAESQNSLFRLPDRDDPRDNLSPWGVASGAEWFSEYPKFNPLLKNAGVNWLRGFYEWQSIQPKQGQWNWKLTDRLVENANINGIHLTFAFAYFATWASADGGTRKFPVKNMQFWRDYVSSLVSRYNKHIKYWEVWNEFNGSFAENGTPEIYGIMVREASIAAKKIDPTAKIGLSVANFDVNFLNAAIKAGAAGHFDYICVHPYEKLSALEDNGEVDFLSMAATLRQMLAANNQPVDTPLWITEIGAQTPVQPNRQGDKRQAVLLVKAYILSIISGFQRVFWFEARGPTYGNEMDHGLLRADFTLRPSYQALRNLTDMLGPDPASIGWVKLGANGYGFLFKGSRENLLAAWSPSNQDIKVKFDTDVQISDLAGNKTSLPAGQTTTLTETPQLITNVPVSLVEEAKANKQKPYPWGRDYSKADAVTTLLQVENIDNGVHQISPDTTVPVIVGDNSWRRTDFSKPGSEGHYVYFAVAPQFVPFGTADLEITAVVRRLAPNKVAGMSLNYESGKGYVDASYFNIPESDQWQELTWKIADANFVGQWGWNFRFSAIASPNEFLIREVRVRKPVPH